MNDSVTQEMNGKRSDHRLKRYALLVLAVLLALGSGYFLFEFAQAGNWRDFVWVLSLSFASAFCVRFATGFPAFSVLVIFYAIFFALLSLAPISFFLFPPPADPVGGAGIGAGMAILFLGYCVPTMAPITFLSFWIEKRSRPWYVIAMLLYLPAAILVLALLTGIAE